MQHNEPLPSHQQWEHLRLLSLWGRISCEVAEIPIYLQGNEGLQAQNGSDAPVGPFGGYTGNPTLGHFGNPGQSQRMSPQTKFSSDLEDFGRFCPVHHNLSWPRWLQGWWGQNVCCSSAGALGLLLPHPRFQTPTHLTPNLPVWRKNVVWMCHLAMWSTREIGNIWGTLML